MAELIKYRSDQALILNAALNLGALPIPEIRSRASKLIERIKEFEETNELSRAFLLSQKAPRGASSEERDAFFKKQTAEELSNEVQYDSAWRIYYLPELLALLNAAQGSSWGALRSPAWRLFPPYGVCWQASIQRLLPLIISHPSFGCCRNSAARPLRRAEREGGHVESYSDSHLEAAGE